MPISVSTATHIVGKQVYERQIMPLQLAYSITIHKSQSLTMPSVIIDLGNRTQGLHLKFLIITSWSTKIDFYKSSSIRTQSMTYNRNKFRIGVYLRD